MKRIVSSLLIATALVGSAIQPAAARDHHHHDNTGRIIAGGVAAGVVGGLIGGALANSGPRYVEGPRYYDAGPPPPRCWYEDRDVRNRYDGGYHTETVRVCD